MSTLFETRERAAEGLFAHNEETRFLVRRRAVEGLAAWAGESIGLDVAGQAAYAQHLVDRFVAGTPEDQLVVSVQVDLERAGRPSLSGQVATVLAQATAQAHDAFSAKPTTPVGPSRAPDLHEEFDKRHPKSHASWSL